MDSNQIVESKLRALQIRQQIERLATEQWALFSGHSYDTLWHSNVALRLQLLIPRAKPQDRHRAYAMVIALAGAYRATSHIIHGRSEAARTRSVHFEEWEQLLAEAGALLEFD